MPPKRKRGRPRKAEHEKKAKKPRKQLRRGRPYKLTGVELLDEKDITFEDPVVNLARENILLGEMDLPSDVFGEEEKKVEKKEEKKEEKEEEFDLPIIDDEPSATRLDPNNPISVERWVEEFKMIVEENKDEKEPEQKILLTLLNFLNMPDSKKVIVKEVSQGSNKKSPSMLVLNALHAYVYYWYDMEWDQDSVMKSMSEGYVLTDILKRFAKGPYLKELLTSAVGVLKSVYLNIKSQSKVFTDLRQALLKLGEMTDEDKKIIKGIVHIDREQRNKLNEEYKAKVKEMHKTLFSISQTAIVDLINTLRTSEDWRDQFILIGLATGSRQSEILWRSVFEEVKGAPYLVRIVGVAKDRHKVDNKSIATFQKPVLGGMTGAEVVQTVNKIRSTLRDKEWNLDDPDEKEARNMTTKLSQELGPFVSELFGGWKQTFHKLRALYAEAAYEMFPPVPYMTKPLYFSTVLGHSDQSMTTSLSYMRFQVKPALQTGVSLPGFVEGLAAELKEFKQVLERENVFPKLGKTDVELLDGEGKKFILTKQPNRHDKDQEARYGRLREHIAQLKDKGLVPTYRILQKLGYGTTTIRRYWIEAEGRPKQKTRVRNQEDDQ